MKKICFITAVPQSAYSFLKDHMLALQKHYSVYYISNERDESKIASPHDGYYYANIQRGISPLNDIKGLLQLYKLFRKEEFHAVHSVTPKAGLLTAIAAFFARVPVRIHIFTGQVWANKRGLSRFFLKLMDKMIAFLDNQILVDGEGQRRFLISEGVVSSAKSTVLAKGSICGVNLDRFAPDAAVREEKRAELNIESNKLVFVFMGRLNHDKGMIDLLAAFNRLAKENKDVFLLLFGNDEENISEHFQDYKNLKEHINYYYFGRTNEPYNMLQAGDVFVLPTYREGFGSSVIEASALGLPVICSDAYGVMDAMIDGKTGLRCKVGDVESIYNAMKKLANNPDLRELLGKAGRKRVIDEFDGKKVTQAWVDFYLNAVG